MSIVKIIYLIGLIVACIFTIGLILSLFTESANKWSDLGKLGILTVIYLLGYIGIPTLLILTFSNDKQKQK